jgi:hypothetical protein
MFMQTQKAEKSTHYARNYEKLLLLKRKYAAIPNMIKLTVFTKLLLR